jgi:nitrite reductase/ring-hydroxylating ferredoxin subunit
MSDHPVFEPTSDPTRRTVLRAAGTLGAAAAAGAALTACGGTGGSGRPRATPSPVSGIPTSEIPVGGGRIITNAEVVVTQPSQGTFKAFSAICPHQGCEVSEVVKNTIVCPCHGSTFDATTGDRLSGPAQSGLTPLTVTESSRTLDVS